jgi:hypothetical protein
MVANKPFQTFTRHATNTYVPSFAAAAQVIIQMNYLMSTSHRFLQGAPEWSPFMSLSYFGMLWYLQIFRAERSAGILPTEHQWILDAFEANFDLRSFAIPGPLVPYYQSLTAHSGPNEHYGNICPAVPSTPDSRPSSFYLRTNTYLLPAIPTYLDAMSKLLENSQESSVSWNAGATAPGSHTVHRSLTDDTFKMFIDRFWRDIHGTTVDATTSSEFMAAPGMQQVPHYSLQQYQSSHRRMHYMDFPPALIPSIGLGTGSVLWTYPYDTPLRNLARYHAAVAHHDATATVPGTPAVPAHYTLNVVRSMKVSGSHADADLEEVVEQTASIAQTHVAFHDTATHVVTYHTGEIWSLPPLREIHNLDYLPSVNMTLISHYHKDTRS